MFQLRHYFHKNGIICGKKRYKESNNYWGEGKNKKADCSVRGEKGKKENWLNDALVLTCRTSFGGTSRYVSASGNQVDTYCWGEPPWERPPWFAKIWIARCKQSGSLCDRTVKWISRVRLKKGSLLRVSGRKICQIGVYCDSPFIGEFLTD